MDINTLHDQLFVLLNTIDEICKKNDLTYFLDGGVELGSVRELDFIAWDDDIDLKIFAEDWPVFLEVMKRELPEHLHIWLPEDYAPAYFDMTFRIYDDRYLLREPTEEDRFYNNMQNHLGADIFILCKIPKNRFRAKLFDIRNRMIYGYGIRYRYVQKDSTYSFKEKMQVRILSALGKRYTADEICKKWYRHAVKYNHLTEFQRYAANWPLDDIRFLRSDYYDETALGTIRNRKYPIPGGYEAELTCMYGDWRTPRDKVKENGKAFERHLDES